MKSLNILTKKYTQIMGTVLNENVKQQPDLVQGVPETVVGGETEIGPDALEKGTKHEMKHTKDPLVAKSIAMDHLRKDPQYYEKLAKAGLEEAPAPAVAPTKPATPTVPGTPTTKPGRPHPLTPTRPGISPRPKAESTQDDVQMFLAKRTQYKQ